MAGVEIWRSNAVCTLAEHSTAKEASSLYARHSLSFGGKFECANCTGQQRNTCVAGRFEAKWKKSLNYGKVLTSKRRGNKIVVAEAGVDTAGEIEASGPSVQVTFTLQRRCHFGQRFHISGSESVFGCWNLDEAMPMEWSDNDVWSVKLDVPVGTVAEYKYVLIGKRGELEWSPGGNKVLDTTAITSSTLLVQSPWNDAEVLSEPQEDVAWTTQAGNQGEPLKAEEEAMAAIKVLDDAIANVESRVEDEVSALSESTDVEETKEGLGEELNQPLEADVAASAEHERTVRVRDGTTGVLGEDETTNGVALSGVKDSTEVEVKSEADLSSNPSISTALDPQILAAQKQPAVGEEEGKARNEILVPLETNFRKILPFKGSVLAKDANWGMKVWESLLGSLGRKPLMEEESKNRLP